MTAPEPCSQLPCKPRLRGPALWDMGRQDSLPCPWLPSHHHPPSHHCEMSVTEWPQGHSAMLTLPQ